MKSKLRIQSDGTPAGTRMFLDGKELRGVVRLTLDMDAAADAVRAVRATVIVEPRLLVDSAADVTVVAREDWADAVREQVAAAAKAPDNYGPARKS